MPRLRQMAEEAGRDPQSLSVTLGGAPGSGRSSLTQNPGDLAGGNPVDLGNLGNRHAVLHQGPDTHELRARDLAHRLRLGGGRSFALLVTDWHRR
jgi:hypothetical protein